ncbi:MAG: DNA translocase FtsK 4TM domain-containing protein [Candidatus Binatia bacterium]
MARARAELAPPEAADPVETPREAGLLDEVAAIVCLAAAAFLAIGFFAYQSDLPSLNLAGKVGHGLADLVVQGLGFGAYLIPLGLLAVAVTLFRHRAVELGAVRAVAASLLVPCAAILFGLTAPASRPVALAGGWIGGFLAALLAEPFGAAGSFVLVAGVGILAFIVATRLSLGALARGAGRGVMGSLRRARTVAEQAEPVAQQLVRKAKPNVKRAAPADDEAAPVIVLERRVAAPKKKRVVQEELPFGDERYQSPPLRLLLAPKHDDVRVDEEALRRSSQILETKLADFGIVGKVVEVRPGPVITTFDIEPAPGVKVNRITSLGDDLAMALRVPGVRILAPVPGKAVVGIEVANPRREEVTLRELVEVDEFQQSASPLALALGKDTAGQSVIGDLARMPHLMIAGATGSGKSVAINAMIMSILYKAPPREVRFVMIDLKMLELSVYEDIPHLLVPVVTDPKQAVYVLNNIVELMEERYRLMKKHGVRNIDGYNKLIDEQRADAGGSVIELKEVADDADDEDVVTPAAMPERLPKVVVIIDELADLMMTMGRKVEEPITRLAQKARAAGVHLIVATQRPSVDVITGLIKANFPSRVSFQVTARVDSRTILDQIGAERLLGRGDMLYMSSGSARLQRLHGPLVTEEEIHKAVGFIKKQGRPQYAFALLEAPEGDEEGGGEDDLSDELYDQAVALVTSSRQASISWVQRRLRVGYNRAARMIERMEREGVVSASEGGRPREVLAPPIEAD